MNEVCLSLSLSAAQCERYYAGHIKYVQAQSDDGRQIRFPAQALLPYISHTGVQGRFVLRFDDQHKFIEMARLT